MAFVMYKKKIKGIRGKPLKREEGIMLQAHKAHPERYPFNRMYRAYLDNILQVSVPPYHEPTLLVKPHHQPQPEPVVGHNIPSGRDLAAGDS